MRTLIEALARLRTADSALVLTWILTNGNAATHGERVALLLVAHQQSTGMVPVDQVTDLLRSADPDRRFAVASFFHRLFSERKPRIGAPDRAAAVEALISTLADPVVDVRRVAAAALGRARASAATPALLQSLELEDASRYYVTTAFDAFAIIGDPRAVPVLERWARTPREYELRLQAARVAVNISKASDRGGRGAQAALGATRHGPRARGPEPRQRGTAARLARAHGRFATGTPCRARAARLGARPSIDPALAHRARLYTRRTLAPATAVRPQRDSTDGSARTSWNGGHRRPRRPTSRPRGRGSRRDTTGRFNEWPHPAVRERDRRASARRLRRLSRRARSADGVGRQLAGGIRRMAEQDQGRLRNRVPSREELGGCRARDQHDLQTRRWNPESVLDHPAPQGRARSG